MAGEEDFVFGLFGFAANGADFDAVVYGMEGGEDVVTYVKVTFAVALFSIAMEL